MPMIFTKMSSPLQANHMFNLEALLQDYFTPMIRQDITFWVGGKPNLDQRKTSQTSQLLIITTKISWLRYLIDSKKLIRWVPARVESNTASNRRVKLTSQKIMGSLKMDLWQVRLSSFRRRLKYPQLNHQKIKGF